MQLHPPYFKFTSCVFLAFSLAFAVRTNGNGKAFHTLVVVNTNSPNSVELGQYYAESHGIPDHHICEIALTTNWGYISSNDFRSLMVAPITNHIATNGLSGRIDFVVLCQDLPTRIEWGESTTAGLFYGFKDAPRYSEAGCNLPIDTSNEFFRAERAFRSADGWNNTNGFITFQLVASNLPTAKLVVDRGVTAQGTFPPSSINLYILGSRGRSVRETRYADTQFSFTSLPGLVPECLLGTYQSYLSGSTNAMGYQDGFGGIPTKCQTNNVWLPGAYADHLTSCGGMILDPCYNQSTVLNWMGIGVTASYGTVDEPCAFIEKFPEPLTGFWYARGFTIGEAYAMAVEAPYQGLFAGDPLAAPFAAPPALSITSQLPNQIVTGTVPIQVTAIAHTNGAPPADMDWYIDSVFQSNLVTVSPEPGNQIGVAVAGHTNSITVASSNESLFDVVSALASNINADTSSIVSASARGDRLQLVYEHYDRNGDNAPVSAFTATGTASALTLDTGLAATNLHPSIYAARKKLLLYAWTSSNANAGDTVTSIITLTNGIAVTNHIVATQSESIPNLFLRLGTAINAEPTLQATNGVRFTFLANGVENVANDSTLFARSPGPEGAGIQVDYSISAVSNNSGLVTNTSFSAFMNDNPDDVRARASILYHVKPSNNVLTAGTLLDTSLLSDGVHTLDFVSRDGSGVAAASRLTLPLVICNSSPQLSLLGTNGVAVTNGEPASLLKGTDFGSRQWNQAATNIFSLHNNGTAELTITGWTTNGSGAGAYQISGIPSVIEAGSTSNFTVAFTPSTSILYSASLAILSDAILPQTNLLFSGTGISYEITIQSPHGTSTPAVGIHTNIAYGTVISNSCAAPVPVGGTQFVCTGWSLLHHDPSSGSATNFEMTVTNNAVLTWQWTTNFWLEPTAGDHGSVNAGTTWVAAAATTQITATADLYYHFTNWSGDASGGSNPLALLMDAPKTVQANFQENLAAHDTPEWWLAAHGWTNNFDAAATNDPDTDGYFTWQEYISDTNPTNSDSFFPPLEATLSASNLQFGINPTSTGRQYHVDVASPITNANWSNVTNAAGNGGTWEPNLTPPGPGSFFYRGRVTLNP